MVCCLKLKGWADGQYERHLVRRYFEQFREKTLKREVDDAIKNLKGYIEQPLMKVVAVACHERELRGDLEVILEECLALLVRCMKVCSGLHNLFACHDRHFQHQVSSCNPHLDFGCLQGGVDSDQGLQGRLRNQIGRLLDARWIIRNRTTDKVAGGAAPYGELPAKPWEEWDEAGGRSRRTTDSERRGAYQVRSLDFLSFRMLPKLAPLKPSYFLCQLLCCSFTAASAAARYGDDGFAGL